MIDARVPLIYLMQPVLSFTLAALLVALCMVIFRPRSPRIRSALLLLPLLKILIDVATLSPAEWIGTSGTDPRDLPSGSRNGMLSIAMGGWWMAPRLSVLVTYDPDGVPDTSGVEMHETEPASGARVIHPADYVEPRIGADHARGICVLVVVIGLLFAATRLARLHRLRRWIDQLEARATAPPPGAIPRDESSIPVHYVPDLTVPMATGFLRPRIFVPVELAASLSASELAALIRHEEAHVRRRDPLLKVLLGFFQDVCWYVPGLGRWMARYSDEVEVCCDLAAVESESSALPLARALVTTARLCRVPRVPVSMTAAIGTSQLTERLHKLTVVDPPLAWPRRILVTGFWIFLSLSVLGSSLAPLG